MNASEKTLAELTTTQREDLQREVSVQTSLLQSGKPVANVLHDLANLIRELRAANENAE